MAYKKFKSYDFENKLVERFYRYTGIASQSNAMQNRLPTSEGQMQLAKQLKSELETMSLSQISLSENAILTACLKGNQKNAPAIGFVAHLDTFDAGLAAEIHPQRIINYDGKDICLNDVKNIWLKVAEHPEIKDYIGQDILTSDGTSVLGADNKAAIAIIMTICEWYKLNPESPHGDIWVAFVPDEEVGLRGSHALDKTRLPVSTAYTIDACAIGELIYETFNAGSAQIAIEGITAHPMSAKNIMVNPLLVAVDLINLLNRAEMPEHTENREGYIWPIELDGKPNSARLTLMIRDHDKVKYQAKKKYLKEIVNFTKKRYPKINIDLQINDVYTNIKDALPTPPGKAVDYLKQAMKNCDVEPHIIAMRGGTDGSALSAKGIPTPNFFTGAHNFHSPFEFLPIPSFIASCKVALTLIEIWAKDNLK